MCCVFVNFALKGSSAKKTPKLEHFGQKFHPHALRFFCGASRLRSKFSSNLIVLPNMEKVEYAYIKVNSKKCSFNYSQAVSQT